jgi:hypothetical protein
MYAVFIYHFFMEVFMKKIVYHFSMALCVFVFALSFTGCELIQDLFAAKTPEEPGADLIKNPGSPSIKAKFGITSEGTAAVADTFNTLHKYIEAGGLDDGVIKLGDWIDLEGGLSVAAFNGNGAIGSSEEPQMNEYLGDGKGYLLRLIVVGINSFKSGRGTVPGGKTTFNGDTGGQYTVTDNDDTSHVVFQFQNVPVARRMNETDTNAGGYRDSEMRKYLSTENGTAQNGNFLTGLKNAGVPEGVLWGPKRYVSTKGGTGEDNALSDLLWLPTEREMFHEGISRYNSHQWGLRSVTDDETAQNQARLEYYSGGNDTDLDASYHTESNGKRIKYQRNGDVNWYWEASPYSGSSSSFCLVRYYGSAGTNGAVSAGGCAPAFCVK